MKQEKYDAINADLKRIMTMLTQNGYTCYAATPTKNNAGVIIFAPGASIVTPSDNVLGIEWAQFGGWHFSFEYHPSSTTGSSCSCTDSGDGDDFGLSDVTLRDVQKAEQNGLRHARCYGAKLYKSSDEWKKADYLFTKGEYVPFVPEEEVGV